MKLKAGDYISLEGVSDETLEKVRDKFIEAGFEEGEALCYQECYKLYGVDDHDNKLWFFSSFDCYGNNSRLLTVEQVLGSEGAMPKQERYLQEDGKDLIDKWAERYSPAEFRLIMLAMIEKYMTRMNKKDSTAKECRKIADFANRLALVEEARENESTN